MVLRKIGVAADLRLCTLNPSGSYSSWEGHELLISIEKYGCFFSLIIRVMLMLN